MHEKICWENTKDRESLEEVKLNWILNKQDGGFGRYCYGLNYRKLAGCCEHGNERPAFMKFGEFLD